MVKDLKGDVEKSYAMCENLKEDIVCAKSMRETLVDNLKDELCRTTHNSKDECHLELEDIMKNVEKENYWDVREGCFERREKIVEAKEIVEVVKMKERDKKATSERDEKFEESEDDKEREEDTESAEIAEIEEMEESEEDKESEEEHECENEDSSCRLHGGHCLIAVR